MEAPASWRPKICHLLMPLCLRLCTRVAGGECSPAPHDRQRNDDRPQHVSATPHLHEPPLFWMLTSSAQSSRTRASSCSDRRRSWPTPESTRTICTKLAQSKLFSAPGSPPAAPRDLRSSRPGLMRRAIAVEDHVWSRRVPGLASLFRVSTLCFK